MRAALALVLALMLAMAQGCTEVPTRIVARIESDLAPCTELKTVDVVARWEGGGVLGMTHLDVCAQSLRYPGEVAISPRDPADARRVVLTVSGAVQPTTGAAYTLRQEFVLGFQRGRTLVVRYALSRVCAVDPCPSGFSCVPGAMSEARCASREAPIVVAFEGREELDAAVWGDSVAADRGMRDREMEDTSADGGAEITVTDAAILDEAVSGDVPRPDVPADLGTPTDVRADSGCTSPSTADCDGLSGNGCETNTLEDDLNCGGCGRRCSEGQTCGRVADVVSCVPRRFPTPMMLDADAGTFEPSADAGIIVIPSGQHRYSRIAIPSGVTVRTNRTGVLELWSDGDVIIDGTIDLSGGGGADGHPTYAGGGGHTGTAVDGSPGTFTTCPLGGSGGTRGTVGGDAPGTGPICGQGGNLGGGAGGTNGGGGGGGVAGGGGGALDRGVTASSGAGGFGGGEAERAGGGLTASEGGMGGVGAQPDAGMDPYAGRRGSSGATCASTSTNGAGGGGAIGRAAANDLPVASNTFYPGSGGGGGGGGQAFNGSGGGGGGGALRVVSPTRIVVRGSVLANGGNGGAAGGPGGGGSGGVVVLYAPAVIVESDATLSAIGGLGGPRGCATRGDGNGGLGRIRIWARCSLSRFVGTMMPAIRDPPTEAPDCSFGTASPVAGSALVSDYP